MSVFTIRLAEKVFEVCTQYDYAKMLCLNYLCVGRPDHTVTITQEDIDYERQMSRKRHAKEEGEKYVGDPSLRYPDDYLESLAVYRKIAEILIESDTILFHGSAIAVDGQAYLFTAKSGVGKSTHVRFWREHFRDRAEMINDDKPLLRVTEDGVWVYGTPWSGKHRLDQNIARPLKAICLLSRGEINQISPAGKIASFAAVMAQTYRPAEPDKVKLTIELVGRILAKVDLYALQCNLDRAAAEAAYRGMNNQKKNMD